ncbi:uncharacterized protein [Diabrotica undecimpunctata]|uniref:uncharacterized protein n=1 Tax=Diabrotica undecimpunctata TaxID=50387 RepID=UPI003B63EE83
MACTICSISFFEAVGYTDKKDFLKFFYDHGVLKETTVCRCGNELKVDSQGNFRCYKLVSKTKQRTKRCGFFLSARKGTFFEEASVPIEKIFLIVATLLHMVPPRKHFVWCELKISSQPMINWVWFCREVFQSFVINNSVKLGGPNTIVEIDVAKFGRRRYKGDRLYTGQWAIGGFERNSNNCFLVPVKKIDADILLRIIREWILPGTIIHSDCWKLYDCLNHEGFVDQTVNHTKHFVDPDTPSINVKQLWREVRSIIPRRGVEQDHLVGHLAEFYFKRRFHIHFERLHHFFIAAAKLHPPAY